MSSTKYISPLLIGWATDAYPAESSDSYKALVERQINAGANFIWMGHNNPGLVDLNKIEPGLSYAIYEEAINPNAPRQNEAKLILDSQIRFLDICRKMNVPVVFPVGYQIQMGRWWDERNPDHLRKNSRGKIIDWGGISASFYSPVYRKDILKYYEWTIENIIEPYKDIIILINLADEPFGCDYSLHANNEFKKRTGFSFEEVGDDPERQIMLGEFQSDMVVDYAVWSAEKWHELYPHIPTTMSFCGYHGREENLMPTVEHIFKKTPHHFEPTFDLYPRDGPMDVPIQKPDITSLWTFLIQAGNLSKRYKKPMWMWTTGNSWGTGQASHDKGFISDVLANHYYNTDLFISSGGILKGIAVWNYNIIHQGLYNDTNETTFKPDDMFERISCCFQDLHDTYNINKDTHNHTEDQIAIYAPLEPKFLRIGQSRTCVAELIEQDGIPYNFTSLEMFFHTKTKITINHKVSEIPDNINIMVALPDKLEELSGEIQNDLKTWLKPGKILIINSSLAPLFNIELSNSQYEEFDLKGTLVSVNINKAFRMEFADQYKKLRKKIFKTENYEPTFFYSVPWQSLWYNLSGKDQEISGEFSKNDIKFIFNKNGNKDINNSGNFNGVLEHHTFALVKHSKNMNNPISSLP